ncbi:MAG TPA: DUF190 domain-containing protein [Phycisphaerae bacterium]|nr:DUF190 domain-containing protein [Phycisphaerae bacterium]HOI54006.1 DUF190 domain-containing protein [Phycisphaerae bacterium]
MPLEGPHEVELLRIFIGEGDRCDGRPLYEALVLEARRRGLAGATVLKGAMGFGKNSRLHTASILRLSADLPVVVEIVDRSERIEAFLPEVNRMVADGLVTVEKVRVLAYRDRGTTPAEDHVP